MAFVQRDNEEIVKPRSRVRVHGNDVWIDKLDQLPKQLVCGIADELIFLWRFADDGSDINRISSPCHTAKAHNRKWGRFRIMSKMIAERSFSSPFMSRHNALQYDLGVCGDHDIDALRANHRNTLAAQESRESNLIDVFRKGKNGRYHKNRIRTDDDCDFKIFAVFLSSPIMTAAPFHALPMHPRHIVSEHLKPIHTDISPPRGRIMRDDHSIGNETSGIARPTFQNRKPGQVRRFDDLLTW